MKKIILTFLLAISLMFVPKASAETIIIPIDDLIFTHTNFDAPEFSLNSAINGRLEIRERNTRNRSSNKEKVINLIEDLYPNAKSIRIWKNNVIIRL
jgi:hypothetical protein